MEHRFSSVQQVRDSLKDVNYLADDGIAGVAFLADRLAKPILVRDLPEQAKPSWRKVWPKCLVPA